MDRRAEAVAPAIEHSVEVEAPSRESSFPLSFEVSPEESGLKKILLLWEHRRFLGIVTVCAVIVSSLIAFVIPKRYESTARLMPPDQQSGTGPAMLAALSRGSDLPLGSIAGSLLGAKQSGALFVGILQSRTVADRIIDQFQLRSVYHTSKMEDTRNALAAHSSISEDHKSGIIAITVSDHEPQRAAVIAQAYVNQLDTLVAQVSTSSARRERIFLEERLHNVKDDLDAIAHKFSEFASKNTAIDIPAQGKAMVDAAAALQGELIAAQSELRGLEQIYTEQNVRVRSLHARVAELQQQLNKLGTGESSSQGDTSLYPSIRQLPLLGVTYADLYRQLKIQETVYGLLTQQYELAKVEEAKEIPTVRVLDAADVPTKKVFPPRLLVILVGTFFGFACAAAWIFAKLRWDETEPNDPRKLLAQEVFATIRRRIPGFSKTALPSAVNETRSNWAEARHGGRSR